MKLKIALGAILSGIIVGMLCAIAAFFLLGSTSRRVIWTKFASPPEQAIKILQFFNREYGVLATTSGAAYFCNETNCKLIEDMSVGELAPCEQHIDSQDDEFRKPPSQTGQLVDACKAVTMEELPVTIMLLLYDDNSLWMGAYGYSSIPMYGAEFLFLCIFAFGGMVGFFVGLAVLSSRYKVNKQPEIKNTEADG
jgi:hypothetical protein